MSKIILLVLDSFGIGNAPDAEEYGDLGSNTYGAISSGIRLPNLVKMGLNNIDTVEAMPKCDSPIASYGRLIELSKGKDTTTGHYEMMGVITTKPYPTYPNGFPQEIVDKLELAWGVKIIGNKPASGTEIIKELGDEHIATKNPIVYTSADSVLQIACNEDVYNINELYHMCNVARDIMTGEHNVARVIARPFVKIDNKFVRTENRKDFSLKSPYKTLLNHLQDSGITTIGIGKIYDIFSGDGIDISVKAHNNREVVDKVISLINTAKDNTFIFANLVDFDMLYGHRNDIEGYKKAMEQLDIMLPNITNAMKNDDILIITADHGCDPSTPSTDHSRESVPLIIYNKSCASYNLGTMNGLDNIAGYISKVTKIKNDCCIKYPNEIWKKMQNAR